MRVTGVSHETGGKWKIVLSPLFQLVTAEGTKGSMGPLSLSNRSKGAPLQVNDRLGTYQGYPVQAEPAVHACQCIHIGYNEWTTRLANHNGRIDTDHPVSAGMTCHVTPSVPGDVMFHDHFVPAILNEFVSTHVSRHTMFNSSHYAFPLLGGTIQYANSLDISSRHPENPLVAKRQYSITLLLYLKTYYALAC
jgi:hypothetical protein